VNWVWLLFGMGCGASSPTSSEVPVSEARPELSSAAPEARPEGVETVESPAKSEDPKAAAPESVGLSSLAPENKAAKAAEPGQRDESADEKIPGANGLVAENISCRMEGAMALLGAVLVTAWMAPQKSKLDACAPKGTKVRVAWKVSGGKREFLSAQAEPKLKACVEKVLSPAKTPVEGHCAATLLLGSK
jgi:hypothetical protein